MKTKNEEGITLIALVITIIVLMILAGISISMLGGENGLLTMAKLAKENTEDAQANEIEDLEELEDLIKNNGVSTKGINKEKGVNIPKIGEDEQNKLIPIKYSETSQKWVICSPDDPEWYDYEAVGEDKNKNETVEMNWANAMLSDGKYTVGEPGEGQEKAEVGKEVADSDLGSMFVWIPRYAYSMTEYKTAKTGTTDADNGKTQNITKVEFLQGSSNIGVSGTTYQTDYDVSKAETGKETQMIVHPAFNFGGANLQGIWVAKFEASMKETNSDTTTNNNKTDKTIKILPNEESWRYIQEGNIFKVCLGMKENEEYKLPTSANTHQMKNNEWGAVAYLSASQYGKVSAKNTSGKLEGSVYKSYTASTAESNAKGDYKTNKNQSTTGNVYGVYDMNGGAWEYVAAYWDNNYSNLATYGGDIFPSNKLKDEYIAYFDKYEVSGDDGLAGYTNSSKNQEGNRQSAEAAYQRVQLMKNKKGDAMYEVINNSQFSYYGKYSKGDHKEGNTTYSEYTFSAWLKATFSEEGKAETLGEDKLGDYGSGLYGGDFVLVGTAVQPFLVRGGVWYYGTFTGVFASYGDLGIAYSSIRFPSGGCVVALRHTKKHKGFYPRRAKFMDFAEWSYVKEV